MFGKVHVGWAIGIVYIAISKNIVQAHAPKAMAVAPSLCLSNLIIKFVLKSLKKSNLFLVDC
jgi:hypothetical protein